MIRVAFRQFRAEAAVGFALLAAFAIVLAITGPHLAHVYDAFESSCKAAGDCATAPNPVLTVDKPLQNTLPFIVIIALALVGLFFGAPLIARELETGTFRLAWTQSVTPRRWLVVKLALAGIAAMALGGLLTWMADWWASPLDAVNQNRFGTSQFGYHGVAPIGYAAFAFALGATAGVLLRRTVPAMAVTLAGFAGARLAVTYWVRPNLASPLRESLPLHQFDFTGEPPNVSLASPPVTIPDGWLYSTSVADKAGHAPTSQDLIHACPFLNQASGLQAAPGGKSVACFHKLAATFHTVATYQPGSRFWPFQWAEMGIFLAATLALCGLTYWWLRRQSA
jgi:hypothetical protein